MKTNTQGNTILRFDFVGHGTGFYNESYYAYDIENSVQHSSGLTHGHLKEEELIEIGLQKDTIRILKALIQLRATALKCELTPELNWTKDQGSSFVTFSKELFLRMRKECKYDLITFLDFGDGVDYSKIGNTFIGKANH